MLLENELEAISHWFEETYPEGKFSGHAGYNKKNGTEEYHIVFELYGKHYHSSPLLVPKQIYDAPKEEIVKFKSDYVTFQKRKIAAAAAGLVFN